MTKRKHAAHLFDLNLVAKSFLVIAACIVPGQFVGAKHSMAQTATSSADEKLPVARPYSKCSAAFQRDLKRIGFVYVEPLRESVVAGRKREKSLTRGLIYPIPKLKRDQELRQAIAFAARAARNQGADPWLRSEGGRWLTDSISIGLKRYTNQGDSPFVCTGVDGYLGYMEPQIKKMRPINKKRTNFQTTALTAIDPLLEAVWQTMQPKRPIPVPNFAIRPKAPITQDVIDGAGLREGGGPIQVKVQNTAEREILPAKVDPNTTGSVSGDDPDLPKIQKPDPVFNYVELADSGAVLSKIFDRAIETEKLPADTPNPTAQAGGDTLEILKNTKDWVRGKKPLVEDRTVRTALLRAFSAMEIAYVLDANAYALAKVEKQMQISFDAIRTSHTKHCTCE